MKVIDIDKNFTEIVEYQFEVSKQVNGPRWHHRGPAQGGHQCNARDPPRRGEVINNYTSRRFIPHGVCGVSMYPK